MRRKIERNLTDSVTQARSMMPPKSEYHPESADNEPAPPPSYTESLCTNQKASSLYRAESSTSASRYYSSQIQHQLQDLTTAISSLQTQKSLLSHAQDEKILSLLTHQIQIYLADFASSGLAQGTLILVPRAGLEDEKALPSHYDFKNPEHFDKVVRVSDKEGRSISTQLDGTYGYEDRNRVDDHEQLWYWKDEDMAMRLSGYLRPVRDPRTLDLPPRKEEVQARQQLRTESLSSNSSKGFWSRKKSVAKKEDRPPLIEEATTDIKAKPSVKVEDRVIIDVAAEEVVFRTENDFGLYETKKGWGIVLKLQVILGRG